MTNTAAYLVTQGDAQAAIVSVALTEGVWDVQFTVRGAGNTTTALGRFQVDSGVQATAWGLGPQNGQPDDLAGGSAVLAVGAGGLTLSILGQCTGSEADTFSGLATLVCLKVS